MLLSGCGGGTSAVTSASVPVNPASTLSGNWLITASAPTAVFSTTDGSASRDKVRLALTVDVTGDNIAAVSYGNHLCGATVTASSISSALTGAVEQDGTFSLQSKAGLPDVATIKGKAPSALSLPWSGAYSITFADFPSGLLQACNETVSDSFTATYLPLVSGVYVGTATPVVSSPSGKSAVGPMSLELTLQQGGTALDAVSGRTVSGNATLNGSIKVQGSPCFKAGTASGGLSNVIGNRVQAIFTMDDGSMLAIVGTLNDPTEMKIWTSTIRLASPCVSTGLPPLYSLPVLDKQ